VCPGWAPWFVAMDLFARMGSLTYKRERGKCLHICPMPSYLIASLRFINLDYIFLSTIKAEKVKVIKISYDIACRWSIKLRRRMSEYFEGLQFPEDKFKLEFFIPKFHLPAHGSSCHTKYSFNYRPGVGRTHGENIESGWAHTNPAAISTREMGAGARRSALDGHWGGWNWRKIVGFGTGSCNAHVPSMLIERADDRTTTVEKSTRGCQHGEAV